MVLSKPQLAEPLQRMIALTGLHHEQFSAIYWENRLPYDRADLNGEQYWSLFGDMQSKLEALYQADGESWNGIEQSMVDWSLQLKAQGLRIGLLSNIPTEVRDYVVARQKWIKDYHHRTFSCDLKCAKPEPQIYLECVAGLGVTPQETIFIDDRPNNAAGAAKLGLHAVLHNSETETRQAVAALLA
jgi:putative hydrolase of the HAD superfamily